MKAKNISEEWSRYVWIRISDNGCGMDAETLRQIFIPFYTRKKTGEGTGLGLALAEQIVTSHRGHIAAQSEEGKGTVFHVFLPVMEAWGEREAIREEREGELTLAIADDNAKILQMLSRDFAKLKDLRILTCGKKKELHRLLDEETPDVLVVDAGIEDGSGVDFCMSVQGKYPEILKLVMVDCVTADIVDAKQKKVIDGYLTKPVSAAAILEAIRGMKPF